MHMMNAHKLGIEDNQLKKAGYREEEVKETYDSLIFDTFDSPVKPASKKP